MVSFHALCWVAYPRPNTICDVSKRVFDICHFVQTPAQPFRKLDGVVVGPEMHKEQPRLLIEHVAVQSSYLDAGGTERLDDRINFACHHHEIARDRGFATASRLETNSSRQPHRTSRCDR